MQEEAKN